MSRLLPGLFLLLGAAACGEESACDKAFVGDQGQAASIELVTREGGQVRSLEDGDDCQLITPPQGGQIILAAARVRDMSAGQVQLTGWLLDPASGQVFGLESRPGELVEGADGWAAPARPDSLASFSNIAACPSADLPRDIHDQPWVLALRVEDCAGRSVEAQVDITPRCAPESAALCACLCDMDYRLGDPCP